MYGERIPIKNLPHFKTFDRFITSRSYADGANTAGTLIVEEATPGIVIY